MEIFTSTETIVFSDRGLNGTVVNHTWHKVLHKIIS